MNLNQKELLMWEMEQELINSHKIYGKKRKQKDPKKEKQYEYRLKQKKFINWYKKEHSWVRRTYQKKFRQKWKQEVNNGYWHRPVNREYHTYGWLTW